MNLNEAKQELNKQGYILIKEDEEYSSDFVYTGLPYTDAYSAIISAIIGQIYDGIGEGAGREGRMFNYYYSAIDYISSKNVNGEFVVRVEVSDLDTLISCIWRIAKIERQDNGDVNNKNIKYDYLNGATWREICVLQSALNKANDLYQKEHKLTKPWSEEQIAKHKEKQDKYFKKQEELKKAAEEEKKAAEEAKKAAAEKEENMFIQKLETIEPEQKDLMRAKDLWLRSGQDQDKFYSGVIKQLKLIKDYNKYKRRIVAFYNQIKDYKSAEYVATALKDKIKNFK